MEGFPKQVNMSLLFLVLSSLLDFSSFFCSPCVNEIQKKESMRDELGVTKATFG